MFQELINKQNLLREVMTQRKETLDEDELSKIPLNEITEEELPQQISRLRRISTNVKPTFPNDDDASP